MDHFSQHRHSDIGVFGNSSSSSNIMKTYGQKELHHDGSLIGVGNKSSTNKSITSPHKILDQLDNVIIEEECDDPFR